MSSSCGTEIGTETRYVISVNNNNSGGGGGGSSSSSSSSYVM